MLQFSLWTETGHKAMFILYSVAPLLFRMASSSYFNMALLTSDFYGLLFGQCLVDHTFH